MTEDLSQTILPIGVYSSAHILDKLIPFTNRLYRNLSGVSGLSSPVEAYAFKSSRISILGCIFCQAVINKNRTSNTALRYAWHPRLLSYKLIPDV